MITCTKNNWAPFYTIHLPNDPFISVPTYSNNLGPHLLPLPASLPYLKGYFLRQSTAPLFLSTLLLASPDTPIHPRPSHARRFHPRGRRRRRRNPSSLPSSQSRPATVAAAAITFFLPPPPRPPPPIPRMREAMPRSDNGEWGTE